MTSTLPFSVIQTVSFLCLNQFGVFFDLFIGENPIFSKRVFTSACRGAILEEEIIHSILVALHQAKSLMNKQRSAPEHKVGDIVPDDIIENIMNTDFMTYDRAITTFLCEDT